MDQPSTMIQILPALTGLVGAGLGFAAATWNSYYNNKVSRDTARAQRQRERVEQIYKLTVLQYEELWQLFKRGMFATNGKLAFADPPESPKNQLRPDVEIDMLIALYLPELSEHVTKFKDAQSKFIEQLYSVTSKNIVLADEERQLFSNSYDEAVRNLFAIKRELPKLIVK